MDGPSRTTEDVDTKWMKTRRFKERNYESVSLMAGTNDKIKDLF